MDSPLELEAFKNEFGSIVQKITTPLLLEIHQKQKVIDELRDALAIVDRKPFEGMKEFAERYATKDGYACDWCGTNVYAVEEANRVFWALRQWFDGEGQECLN